jgi:hypothetical protein
LGTVLKGKRKPTEIEQELLKIAMEGAGATRTKAT